MTAAAQDVAPEQRASGFARRALLVEDDAFTRTLLAEMLASRGFETRECASSREALDGFDAFDPDVIVVDIQLERPPNGAQLAQALHARAPYLGVVVISQYPSPDAANVNSPLPLFTKLPAPLRTPANTPESTVKAVPFNTTDPVAAPSKLRI